MIIVFFNNNGAVGKTSLVFHIAWMLRELGHRVVCADFDPQANLTAAFLSEDILEGIWGGADGKSIGGVLAPIRKGLGDLGPAYVEPVDDQIGLIIGTWSCRVLRITCPMLG